MKQTVKTLFPALLLVLFVTSCSSPHSEPSSVTEETGTITINLLGGSLMSRSALAWPPKDSPAGDGINGPALAEIKYIIKLDGTAIESYQITKLDSDNSKFQISVSAGTYPIEIEAYVEIDDDRFLYATGTKPSPSVTVVAGETVSVTITMEQATCETHGDVYPNWIAPTCTEDGNTTRTCTRPGCENEETRTTGFTALGHDHLSSLICKRDGCDHQYVLGDPGPAGGRIIYIAPAGFTMTDDDSTAYYLEAAPANMSTTLRWSTLTHEEIVAAFGDPSILTDIPGTETAIGTGRKNTSLILALDLTAPAALACKNYFVTGYNSFNDWFLPSRDELNQLYVRRADFGLSSGMFWSSSQVDLGYAWYQAFDDGYQNEYNNAMETNVRAVRAF